MAASSAIIGHNATFGIDDGIGGYDTLGEVTEISLPGYSRDAIDVTHLDSDDEYREFIAGMRDAGEFGVTINLVPSASDALLAALDAGLQSYRVTFPNSVTFTANAICTSVELGTLVNDDKLTATATFKVSGMPAWA